MNRKSLTVIVVVLSTVALVIGIVVDPGIMLFPYGGLLILSLAVGGLLTWRVPDNPVGWLVFATGGLGIIGAALVVVATVESDAVLAGWLEGIGNSLEIVALISLFVALLRFPHGDLVSQRWRRAQFFLVGAGVIGVLATLLNGGWGGDTENAFTGNPLRLAPVPFGEILTGLFFVVFPLGVLLTSASLVVRYRRSEGEETLQIKWLAYAGGFSALSVVIAQVTAGTLGVENESWQNVIIGVGFGLMPAAIGVGVLKYRLYDIDVVINRTVVLGVLAAFITFTYALIVVGIGQLIGGDSDGLVLSIAATAIVAVAFEPVRLQAQRWANRIVYGKRATPYEVLSDLTQRLSAAEEGEDILGRLASLLCDGTGAERATIWLGPPGSMIPAATSPDGVPVGDQPDADDEASFAVIHDDEIVGSLEVVKPRGSVLSTAERSLVADLAGSAGAVLGYQRLNNSLAERARELEESRTRLMGVQDQERRRLERDLHEGAEQFIVALKVKVGVASQMAGKHEAPELEGLLSGLTTEAQAALDDVQSLAKGVYPPILESDGLGAAISALASSSPVDVRFERDGVGRYSPEIEAAIYFDISEAVTNAVKHADPPILIELSDRDGMLKFWVTDAGPGFDIDRSDLGSGLENMKDRLDAVGGNLVVRSESGEPTQVSGKIPVG